MMVNHTEIHNTQTRKKCQVMVNNYSMMNKTSPILVKNIVKNDTIIKKLKFSEH